MSEEVAQDLLRSFVERIERLEEEQRGINADKSEVYKEAKSDGFDLKVMRRLIADRRKDHAALTEFEALYDLYAEALGMRGPRLVRARVENVTQFPIHRSEAQPSGVAAGASPAIPSTASAETGGENVAAPESPIGKQAAQVAAFEIDDLDLRRADALALGSDVEPVAPQLRSKEGLPRLPGCQNPDACAGGWDHLCYSCGKLQSTAFAAVSEARQ